jgi:hypothetical protein
MNRLILVLAALLITAPALAQTPDKKAAFDAKVQAMIAAAAARDAELAKLPNRPTPDLGPPTEAAKAQSKVGAQ